MARQEQKAITAFIYTRKWISILAVVVLVGAASLLIYWRRIMTPTENDYGSHIQFTLLMLQKEMPPSYTLAHPLLQVILGGAFWLTRGRLGIWEGMVILMALSNVCSALILYAWLGGTKRGVKEALRLFFAVTFPFVTSIPALAFLDGQYYFGYISLANYHNPTVQLLKPLAVLLFILALRVFDRQAHSRWNIPLAAALVIGSALVKQNYLICLIPALALLMAAGWRQKWRMDMRLGLLGFILPAALILAAQTYVTFLMPEADEGGFRFAPLAVESAFSGFLFWKFLLSVLFPLVVWLPSFRKVLMDREMQLAWLAFLVGVGQLYLFAESGERLLHGNFRWSAQITLFVLFAASIRFIFFRLDTQGSVKQRLGAFLAYLPHLAGGVVYYIYCLVSARYG